MANRDGADLGAEAAEDADVGAPPGDGPVEAVEPLPRLVAGHEPRDVHHHAAAAQVRHLPPRRLRPLRLSLSFPLRLSGDAGFRDGA